MVWQNSFNWQFDYLSVSRILSARHFPHQPAGLPSPQMYCISSTKLRELLMTKLFKSLKIRVSLATNSSKFGDTNMFVCWLILMAITDKIMATHPLNSSPIDELGEGADEYGWWCQVKCESQAWSAGINGNSKSNKHHQAQPHWDTQWRYLPTSIFTKVSQEGGKVQGQTHKCWFGAWNCTTSQSKYMTSEAWQRPVCWIGLHDLQTLLTSIGSILS